MTRGTGKLTRDDLIAAIGEGGIDTVILAVCDMQGRLVGKRVTGHHFAGAGESFGAHFCTYLLATDMELNTPPGFASQNWESGYGDYLARPDWSTLRVIPWLARTALVLCDVVDEHTNDLIEVAPRTILRRQIERLSGLGLTAKMATELEFYLFNDSFDEAHRKGYRDLERSGWYSEDYQLFQATKSESIYRQFRNDMTAAGIPIEFSKGEASAGQHEVNIQYADALESADRAVLFKHGAREIAWLNERAITFMAKPDQTWTGSSGHIHISIWNEAGDTNLFAASDGNQQSMSDLMRSFLAGMMVSARELSLFVAGNVNSYKRYATSSWAPVQIVWARDNRTCGFRIVGNSVGTRIENRIPGGDANPYLAFAAVLAGGLHGIANNLEPSPEFTGNAYLAAGQPRVPASLAEAINAWYASELAVDAFGELVVSHYLNAARVEQDAFDQTVTDWERTRYFERG